MNTGRYGSASETPRRSHDGSSSDPCRVVCVRSAAADTRVAHDTALDAFQLYEWQYCGMAWGWKSREYADAIVRNKQHDALGRFADDALVAAVQLLDDFGLRRDYFDSDELPEWVVEVQRKVAKEADDE